jgi:hypothetical protein
MDKVQLLHEIRSLTGLIYVRTYDPRSWLHTLQANLKGCMVTVSEAQPWQTLNAESHPQLGNPWRDGTRLRTVPDALRAVIRFNSRNTQAFFFVLGVDTYFNNPEVLGLLNSFSEQQVLDLNANVILMFGVAELPAVLAPIVKVVTDQGPTIAEILTKLSDWSQLLKVQFDVAPEKFVGYSLIQIEMALANALSAHRKFRGRRFDEPCKEKWRLPEEIILMALTELPKAYTGGL